MPDINNTIKAATSSEPQPLVSSASAAPVINQAWNDMEKRDAELKNAITGGLPVKPGNVDIYAMPKEFQKHNTVAGSNSSLGMFVMLGALVLLLIAGSGAVLYYLKPDLLTKLTGMPIAKNEVAQEKPAPEEVAPLVVAVATSTEPVATSTEPVIASSTPKEVYLSYNIELARINTFADYFTLINKYGSARRMQQVEAEKLLADASPDKGVATVATLRKSVPILDPLAKIEDKTSDNVATLSVSLSDNQSSGTVDMILENGAWKLDNENWTLAARNEAPVYVTGEDRDNDGLTDKEEDLLGSNKESVDSDADGYSDAVELSGLYDPNKKSGKLIDSGKFASYLAEDGSYSIIRPTQWAQSKDNTDNSVNFRSSDDHYVKIATMENYDKETLTAIYKKKFAVTAIDESLLMSNDTWSGIVSPDGMAIYVMSKLDKTKYYILEYKVTTGTAIVEYKQIFWAMVKGLVIKK